MSELLKRRGRPPKDRGGLGTLTPEEVLAVRAKLPQTVETIEEAAARREKERLRGIERRANEKLVREFANTEDIQSFWGTSRKNADPAQLAEWQARHNWVELLLGDIRTCLEGRQPDEEFIDDVEKQTRAFIQQHGVVGVTVPLHLGFYWQQPDLLRKLTDGDTPSHIFAKFGFLLSIDDWNLKKWQDFMEARRPASTKKFSNGFTQMACACGAPDSLLSVPTSIAERYVELGKPFLCYRCRDLEKKSRALSPLYIRRQFKEAV